MKIAAMLHDISLSVLPMPCWNEAVKYHNIKVLQGPLPVLFTLHSPSEGRDMEELPVNLKGKRISVFMVKCYEIRLCSEIAG